MASAFRYSGSRAASIRERSAIASWLPCHRAEIALRDDARHVLLRLGLHPDGETAVEQQVERLRLGHDAAADRHDQPVVGFDHPLEAAALDAAITGLPVEHEQFRQADRCLALDFAIEFDERPVQLARQRVPQRRLAGTAQPDQRDPRRGARRRRGRTRASGGTARPRAGGAATRRGSDGSGDAPGSPRRAVPAAWPRARRPPGAAARPTRCLRPPRAARGSAPTRALRATAPCAKARGARARRGRAGRGRPGTRRAVVGGVARGEGGNGGHHRSGPERVAADGRRRGAGPTGGTMTNYTGVRHDRKQFNACCSAALLRVTMVRSRRWTNNCIKTVRWNNLSQLQNSA